MSNKRTLKQEAMRYLGYGNTVPGTEIVRFIEECLGELQTLSDRKKSVFRCCPLAIQKHEIQLGTMKIVSKDLALNLKGCREAAVFAATLGADTDRLIRRYECINMAKAVVMQACAAAVLEDYCDQVQEVIAEKTECGYLRPRFSPGYGDFSVLVQKNLLEFLDASKQIGLMMTEASMLTPMKSVTAIIGIGDTDANAVVNRCRLCAKRDCSYRRNDRRGEEIC